MDDLQQIIQLYPAAALSMAFIAGLASSASPCAIAAVPLVVGYVGGYAGGSRQRAFSYSLAFVLGMAASFTAAAAVMVLASQLLSFLGPGWQWLMAGLAIVFGGHLLGLWSLPFFTSSHCGSPQPALRGVLGAAIAGALSGIVFSPCATPVLAGILSVIGSQEDARYGILLMFAYAIGHGALLLAAGSSIGFAQWLARSRLTANIGQGFMRLAGLLLLGYGLYLIWELT